MKVKIRAVHIDREISIWEWRVWFYILLSMTDRTDCPASWLMSNAFSVADIFASHSGKDGSRYTKQQNAGEEGR